MSQRTLKVRPRSILGDKTSLKISIFGYGSSCLHIAIEMSLWYHIFIGKIIDTLLAYTLLFIDVNNPDAYLNIILKFIKLDLFVPLFLLITPGTTAVLSDD